MSQLIDQRQRAITSASEAIDLAATLAFDKGNKKAAALLCLMACQSIRRALRLTDLYEPLAARLLADLGTAYSAYYLMSAIKDQRAIDLALYCMQAARNIHPAAYHETPYPQNTITETLQ